jgi:hypothetical protein
MHLGVDNPRHIAGIASIQIRTHDGMMHALTEVRHIPNIARNFISLSNLDCEAYKYAGGRRVSKVSKGSLFHMIVPMNYTNCMFLEVPLCLVLLLLLLLMNLLKLIFGMLALDI